MIINLTHRRTLARLASEARAIVADPAAGESLKALAMRFLGQK